MMRTEANRFTGLLIDPLASGGVSIGRIVRQVVVVVSLFLSAVFIRIPVECFFLSEVLQEFRRKVTHKSRDHSPMHAARADKGFHGLADDPL